MKPITLLILILLFTQISDYGFVLGEKQRAIINMVYDKTDSSHVINISVIGLNKLPYKDVTVNVFVKRKFGNLKMGDVFTDSIGNASLSFSNKLSGSDSLSNIFVLAKIEDSKELVDTSSQIIIKSTIPFQRSEHMERGMIANRAPIWLIITFLVLFGGVWLIYFKVIGLIRKIKKSSTKNS